MPFAKAAQSAANQPNKHTSMMTQNQFIALAKTFIRIDGGGNFPLRMSKQILSGWEKEGVKNVYLRKNSPLVEPLSVAILRIFQSGICQHFRIIQTSIDFAVNPNVRTAEKDWSQIITLDLTKIFFVAMLISYIFGIFILTAENHSTSLKLIIMAVISRVNIRMQKKYSLSIYFEKAKAKSGIISMLGIFMAGLSFTLLAILFPTQKSFGKWSCYVLIVDLIVVGMQTLYIFEIKWFKIITVLRYKIIICYFHQNKKFSLLFSTLSKQILKVLFWLLFAK